MNTIEMDITTVEEGIVIHGVNCQRTMGSGVAKAIRAKWPKVYEDYLNTNPELGKVQTIHISDQLWVMNCFTQKFYGKDGKKYASIHAVEKCLMEVARMGAESGLSIYMPRIGCGLGGLDWNFDLVPLIEEVERYFPSADFVICIHGD